jgi:hypothetical protein
MNIESYSFGRITIDGELFTSDVILYPDRIDSRWWRKEGHELCVDDLKDVLPEKPEILVVGTGNVGCMKILPETLDFLKAEGIEIISELTEEACKTFNRLSKEKKTIACLHLTC